MSQFSISYLVFSERSRALVSHYFSPPCKNFCTNMFRENSVAFDSSVAMSRLHYSIPLLADNYINQLPIGFLIGQLQCVYDIEN